MISNEKVIKYKVQDLFEWYNIGLCRYSIQGHLQNKNSSRSKTLQISSSTTTS